MSDDQQKVAQMAGDLAEHIGDSLTHDGRGWSTSDDLDEYVIEHVLRLTPDEQRRMRAIATCLLGLTASALTRAGTAPASQEAFTTNPDLAAVLIEVKSPEEYDRDR